MAHEAMIEVLRKKLLAHSHKMATAESCTGGLLAAYLTSLKGSSEWFDRAYITYSNAAKHEMLGISNDIFTHAGAVSEACVDAMVSSLLTLSSIQVGVSVSGIAGPDGGSAKKPVGTVWFGFGIKNQPIQTSLQHFEGDRQSIREQACVFAIKHLTTML